MFKIGNDNNIVLSVVGFGADGKDLKERLDTMVNMYKFKHGRPISVEACAHRLSTILYQKRFFPFQVQAILGGVDKDGKGAVFSYDPAGCYERSNCRVAGAAANLIMPFLDSQVEFNNQYVPSAENGTGSLERPKELFSRATVAELVKDAFDNAAERHIEVGDELQIMLVSKNGLEETFIPLKSD